MVILRFRVSIFLENLFGPSCWFQDDQIFNLSRFLVLLQPLHRLLDDFRMHVSTLQWYSLNSLLLTSWWADLVVEVNLHCMIVLEAFPAKFHIVILTADNNQEGTVRLDAALGLRGWSWVATKNLKHKKRIKTPDETREKDRNYMKNV